MMIGTDLNLPKLRVFTWHIHGSYLYYLSQGNYEIYIPVNQEKSEGYYGKGETFPFGPNVIEIPAAEVKNIHFDLVLFQTDQNFLKDQYEILSERQRKLPRIFLEHDPPWGHPTNTKHPVNDSRVVLVHVTHFNQLMWDNHALTTKVITHGVTMPTVNYSGKLKRGIVVINNLPSRGRLLGLDLFEEIRQKIPLDLVGMGSDGYGIGEVLHPDLPAFISDYRFFFNPIRYTSLGLAVCEAMMLGMPIVGLATTEMSVAIKNGYSGFIHTDINYLVDRMDYLLNDHAAALTMSKNAKESALTQFSIDRFTKQWEELFRRVIAGDVNGAAMEFSQLGFQH
jgi:glycosyltransferase involved in cell wall biosynthesis